MTMPKTGTAIYNEKTNELEVTRAGYSQRHTIKCTNLNRNSDQVHGVEIDGDKINVLTSPRGNKSGPQRKIQYSMNSLSGGGSTGM